MKTNQLVKIIIRDIKSIEKLHRKVFFTGKLMIEYTGIDYKLLDKALGFVDSKYKVYGNSVILYAGENNTIPVTIGFITD